MDKIVHCKACGKTVDKYGNKTLMLCSKHFQQLKKYGKILDNNIKTIYDTNEIRIFDDYAEIDTYDKLGNVTETYQLDLEDIKYLLNKKWRTTYKCSNKNIPYLVTGHTIYFHRLIMGNPDCEIDHINRDTHNNCKSNLRFVSRQEQMFNTIKNNFSGIKGVYFNFSSNKRAPWRCEIQYNGKRYYSPHYETKEEAAYYRYLLETIFLKDFLICNTQEMQSCINKLSIEQKESIQKCFKNKMKI